MPLWNDDSFDDLDACSGAGISSAILIPQKKDGHRTHLLVREILGEE
jgi:hypothetical protein